MIDVKETVISQYADSPVICRLISRFDECIDPRADRRRFYDTVWNVSTAQGFGLDIWGAIVGIGREVMIAAQDEYIGFTQALPRLTTAYGAAAKAWSGNTAWTTIPTAA